MPIFEYECQDCGHRFERIVFGSETAAPCPHCKSLQTERLISSFACSGGSSKAAAASSSCGSGKFT